VVIVQTNNHGIIPSYIYTPFPPFHHQQKKTSFSILLKGTSGILVVSPHIPIMADTVTSNRSMSGSLSRVPIQRCIPIRSGITILVNWSLSSNSRGVGSVTLTHISGRGMGRKDIGVIVSVGIVL